MWMDSGNLILQRLDSLYKYINQSGIYSNDSGGTILEWTHPKTLEYMNCNCFLQNICKSAACIGLNTKIEWVKSFIDEFKKLALIKECIAPEGSNRLNHRQDQAIFNILFYKYKKIYKFPRIPIFFLNIMKRVVK